MYLQKGKNHAHTMYQDAYTCRMRGRTIHILWLREFRLVGGQRQLLRAIGGTGSSRQWRPPSGIQREAGSAWPWLAQRQAQLWDMCQWRQATRADQNGAQMRMVV